MQGARTISRSVRGLILNTPDTLKQICAFIDLDYDDVMLRYYTRTPERLKEHHGRYRADGTVLLTHEKAQPATSYHRAARPSRVFGWKSTMSARERTRFGRVAGDLMEELGYGSVSPCV